MSSKPEAAWHHQLSVWDLIGLKWFTVQSSAEAEWHHQLQTGTQTTLVCCTMCRLQCSRRLAASYAETTLTTEHLCTVSLSMLINLLHSSLNQVHQLLSPTMYAYANCHLRRHLCQHLQKQMQAVGDVSASLHHCMLARRSCIVDQGSRDQMASTLRYMPLLMVAGSVDMTLFT